MKHLITIALFLLFVTLADISAAQNVGIGTTTPHAKAALEINATDRGVLFPRLTSAQRNAISNPPNGLHIFNTDERCLNFYDSIYQTWNCYCDLDTCKQVTITLSPGCSIDFKTTYAASHSGVTKFILLVNAGDTIYGCGTAAINFSTLTTATSIKIINRGAIIGNYGFGGSGATGNAGSCVRSASAGATGGNAILTSAFVPVTISNYGFIAGGGGGGGGGGSTGAGIYGGGGGNGAGASSVGSIGGKGGGTTFSGPFGSCGTIASVAQDGKGGTITTSGAGGIGANGGGDGGTGGLLGQQGQSGTGPSPGAGGAAGKAISGGAGNVIINLSGGQTIGVID